MSPPNEDADLLFTDEVGAPASNAPTPGGPAAGSPAAGSPAAGPGGPPPGLAFGGPVAGGPASSEPAAGSPAAQGSGDLVFREEDPSPIAKRSTKRERTSGRFARIASMQERSATRRGASQDAWDRRQRSPAETEAALRDLEDLALPAPQGDVFLGRDLGPFKVQHFLWLDRGARAYLAQEEESKEPVLLRVFPQTGSYGEEFKVLASRGERACRVEHPSLAFCYGTGKTKAAFYVGHEVPMGRSLTELLEAGEVFSEADLLTILEHVGGALGMLHGRDLVHGNVSLDTIRRERSGSYVLTEAGLARSRPEYTFLSAGGEVLGTPGYIAPEGVDSGKLKPAGELYALGCVAWTLATQQPPFGGEDPVQILLNQLNGEVPALPAEGVDASPGLRTVIGKLTGYTVTTRYKGASELLSDLKKVEQRSSVEPFASDLHADPFEEGEAEGASLNGGALLLFLLFLADLALGAALFGIAVQTRGIEPTDPVEGYQLPLPGVSQGGFGKVQPDAEGRRLQRARDAEDPKKGEAGAKTGQ